MEKLTELYIKHKEGEHEDIKPNNVFVVSELLWLSDTENEYKVIAVCSTEEKANNIYDKSSYNRKIDLFVLDKELNI